MLTRREAALRAAATACLAAVALVQALGLPAVAAQGRVAAGLSAAAMVLCVAAGWALAAAPGGAGRAPWGAAGASAALVLAGWAVPRAAALAWLPGAHGRWTAPAGLACAVAAALVLGLAVAALRPRRAALRGGLTAAAVVAALAPGVGALLVALGPVPAGGEAALAAGAHVHQQASFESTIKLRPGSGRHGSRYVYRVVVAPRPSPLAVALTAGAALAFTAGAAGALRRRSAPGGRAPARGAGGVGARLA